MIHVIYAKMSDGQKEVVDEAFEAAYNVLQAKGFPVANDDRAERLVEAVAVYVTESRK